MVDQPGAIALFVPEANVFQEYWGHHPKWICLHKTASAGSAQRIAQFFQTTPDKRSVHYVVGQDGTIAQCVQEKDGAGGNCCLETGHAPFLPAGINMNLLTLSIEHVDPASDNATPLTLEQKEASFRLVKDLCARHAIPMRKGDANGGIIGHCDIAPLSRAHCPGNYPWEELFAFLQEESVIPLTIDMPNVANLFRQLDANHWQSLTPPGRILQFALLDDYKARGAVSLEYLGDVISPELYQPNGDVVQFYQHGARMWQKSSGKVLPFDVFSQTGQEILRKLLAVPAPAPEVPQEHADMLHIKQIVAKY